MLSIKRQVSNSNLTKYLDASQKAMCELYAENFNSKTLKQLFLDPKFRSQEADTVIVKSKETGEPVKVFVRKTFDLLGEFKNFYYNFYKSKENIAEKDLLAEKSFAMSFKRNFGFPLIETYAGMMKTKTDEFVGLGIRADELQIKDALAQGATSIRRTSIPTAILYHLKMGFVPRQELVRIKDEAALERTVKEILVDFPESDKHLLTPIVIKKETFWGEKFFIDINNTKAVAFLRKAYHLLKEKPEELKRPFIRGALVDMELSGENLTKWKDAIDGKGCFDTTV